MLSSGHDITIVLNSWQLWLFAQYQGQSIQNSSTNVAETLGNLRLLDKGIIFFWDVASGRLFMFWWMVSHPKHMGAALFELSEA